MAIALLSYIECKKGGGRQWRKEEGNKVHLNKRKNSAAIRHKTEFLTPGKLRKGNGPLDGNSEFNVNQNLTENLRSQFART